MRSLPIQVGYFAYPPVRRGTKFLEASEPKVWLWPTCFPGWKGVLFFLAAVEMVLLSMLPTEAAWGLLKDCLSCLNAEVSFLSPVEAAGFRPEAFAPTMRAAASAARVVLTIGAAGAGAGFAAAFDFGAAFVAGFFATAGALGASEAASLAGDSDFFALAMGIDSPVGHLS